MRDLRSLVVLTLVAAPAAVTAQGDPCKSVTWTLLPVPLSGKRVQGVAGDTLEPR
jgi:hypothetical protein